MVIAGLEEVSRRGQQECKPLEHFWRECKINVEYCSDTNFIVDRQFANLRVVCMVLGCLALHFEVVSLE